MPLALILLRVCVCVCVCIYQIAHNRAIRPCHPSHSMPLALILPRGDNVCMCTYITAQFGPVILVITCHSHCVCVCVVIPFILDVRLFVDVPAGVTQEEGHTGFFIRLPSAVLVLIFIARRKQPSLSLIDREVEFCVTTNQSFPTCWAYRSPR